MSGQEIVYLVLIVVFVVLVGLFEGTETAFLSLQKVRLEHLVNTGVKLATTDSLVVEELRHLEQQGVEILACGTCLAHLELMDKVGAGQVSDMYTIADRLFKAEKIVSL